MVTILEMIASMIADISNYIDILFKETIEPIIVGFALAFALIFVIYQILTNFSEFLGGFIRFFINISALVLTMGGAYALFVGLFKLIYDISGFMEIDTEKLDEVFLNLIHIAEYLLVGITFFIIAKRLTFEPYFKSGNKADPARILIEIPDLEKHIIGMVIATISVAFVGFIVGGDHLDTYSIITISVAAFIISLGIYIKLSSSNDVISKVLHEKIIELHNRENESMQEITQLKSEVALIKDDVIQKKN
jgi:hypothetical protein